MPDHQIVIKLDKKRFNEAQRLAKQAGYRSATSFLREQVVSLLDNPDGELDSPEFLLETIHQIDAEILKMQQEMQVFINEAEENYDQSGNDFYEFPETNNFGQFSDSRGATMEEAGASDYATIIDTTTKNKSKELDATTYAASSTNTDDREKIIWRAPVKDIPLEEEDPAERQPITEPAPSKENDQQQVQEEQISDPIEQAPEADTAEIISEPEPTASTSNPEKGESPEEAKAAAITHSAPDMQEVLSAVDEANDELEEMADRAFSISPRLGSFEDDHNSFPISEDDPLADLLDDTLLEVMKTGENAPLETRIVEHQFEESPEDTEPEDMEPENTEPEEESEASKPNAHQSAYDQKKNTEQVEEPTQLTEQEQEPETEEEQMEEEDSDQEQKSPDSSMVTDNDEDEEPEDDVERHDLSSGPPPKRRK